MYEHYTEERGFQRCKNRVQEIHHIKGESETLEAGGDPEHNTPLPLCRDHHTKNTSWDEHTNGFAFHPDFGEARKRYRSWKQQEEHLNSITGKKTIDYSTSPFADAAKKHQQMIKKGERYIAGTDEIDQYYKQRMTDEMVRHHRETGELRPKTKPHPRADRTKRKSWTDIYMGTRSYPQDEDPKKRNKPPSVFSRLRKKVNRK